MAFKEKKLMLIRGGSWAQLKLPQLLRPAWLGVCFQHRDQHLLHDQIQWSFMSASRETLPCSLLNALPQNATG